MSTGIEVARISVKVSPDTRTFGKELKGDLERIEKATNADVPISPNLKGFREEVKAETSNLPEAKVKVNPDINQMQRKLGQVNLAFERQMRNALGHIVSPSTIGDMEKKLGQVNLAFERGMRNAMSHIVSPETISDMQKKLSTINLGWDKQVEAIRRETRQSRVDLQPEVLKQKSAVVDLKVDLDYDVSEFELALKRAQAATREVDVALKPDLKMSRFVAAKAKISSLFSTGIKVDVGGAFSRAAENLSKLPLPSFGSGINPAGYAAMAVALSTIVVPAIGILSASLTTIPALLAGIATPIAAVALGLDGIKKSAEVLKTPFEDLKNVMSATFEQRMTPMFENLKSIFPILERSMPRVANGISILSEGLTSVVTGPQGSAAIEGTINNIATALSNASPGLNDFTQGFLTMADKVSAKFPGLSEMFNNLGGEFGEWVTKITTPGKDGITQLDSALSTLKGTLSEIGGIVTDSIATGFDWMSDPKMGENLKNFAADIRSIVKDSLPEMKSMFEDMSVVVGGAADAIKKLKEIAPFKDENGEGSVFESSIQAIPIVGSYINMLTDSANGAAGATQNLDAAMQAAGQNAEAAKKSLEQALLGPALNGNTGATTPKNLEGMLDGLVNPGQAPVLAPPVTDPAQEKLAEYEQFVSNVTAQVKGALEQATSGESLPAPNFEAFKTAWSELPGFVTQQIDAIKTAASSALNGVVQEFVTAGGRVVSEVQTWPAKISSALEGLYAAGQEAGAQVANGLIAGMQGGIPGVENQARAIARAAKLAAKAELGIKSPSREFMEIGDYAAQGLGLGLENGTQGVIDQATALAEKLTAAMENGIDFSNVLKTDELEKTLDAIDLERKRLKVEKNEAGDKSSKDAIQSQMDQLQAQRDILSFQKERIKGEEKYADEASQDPMLKLGESLTGAGIDYGLNVATQFAQDLGISGEGVLSRAASAAIDYGRNALGNVFNFNVSSMDEALSAKDREESKLKLAAVGR